METEEPEAYQIGWVPFLGLTIWLDSKPLIPRVETEWWTELFINQIKSSTAPKEVAAKKSSGLPSGSGQTIFSPNSSSVNVLDLCAGSGAIGCALLKAFPNAKVYFGEIDPVHEATIRKNIKENNLDESRAVIGIGDLFAPFTDIKFDFIASNPPYIPQERVLPESVQNYEPALALRAGVDGLSVIRRIAKELRKYLAPGGQAWIECDSEHAASACSLFKEEGFSTRIMNDQYERPRIIVVS